MGSYLLRNPQGDSNPNEHTGEFFTHGKQRGNPQLNTMGDSSSTQEEGFFPTKHTGRFLPLHVLFVHRVDFQTSTPEHTKGILLHCTQVNSSPLHTRDFFSTAHKGILLHCTQGNSSPLHTREFFSTAH
jgi:hypothetical protein